MNILNFNIAGLNFPYSFIDSGHVIRVAINFQNTVKWSSSRIESYCLGSKHDLYKIGSELMYIEQMSSSVSINH